MNWDIETILDQSISQIASGKARRESCLLAYPAFADELDPLLLAASTLQAIPVSTLSPAARAQIEAQILDAAAANPLKPLTATQRQRLLAGEAVFDHVRTSGDGQDDSGHGRAMVLIDAPVERCVEIFSALDQQHHYFPRKTVSEVVERSGNQTWVRSEYDYTVRTIAYTVRYTYDPARHRFDFALDKRAPHDIAELAGYFAFERVEEDCTLLSYVVTRLESGLKVPEFLRKALTRRDLPNQVLNVKRRIESGGKWTK